MVGYPTNHVLLLAVMCLFNTAGPVVAADHCYIPPLERANLRELLTLMNALCGQIFFRIRAGRMRERTMTLLGSEPDARPVAGDEQPGEEREGAP